MFDNFQDLLDEVNKTPLVDPLLDAGVYNMVVKSARKVPSKGRQGAFNYVLVAGALDHPDASDVFHYFPIPITTDEPKSKHYMLQKMAQFCASAKITMLYFKDVNEEGGDEQLVGITFPAKIGVQDKQVDESTGQEYKPKNIIEEFIFSA